jgi:hypothetical protein
MTATPTKQNNNEKKKQNKRREVESCERREVKR